MNASLKKYWERARECYDLKELERLGLTPTLEQRDMFLTFFALIFKWNKAAGLISPKDEDNLFVRHFCDSLQPLLLFGFKKNASALDIGAGGGFPSIPTAVFRPDLKMVLVESNRKKAQFLLEVKKEINLPNVEIFNGRVETMVKDKRQFDYILSRGLGTLRVFARLAQPLCHPEGRMYTFKSKSFAAELEEIANEEKKDGVRIAEIAEYDLANKILGLNLVSLAVK